MNRCKYCGKKIEPSQDFCGLPCEKQYNARQMTQDQRKIKFFTAGMLAGFLVMLGGVLSLRDALVARRDHPHGGGCGRVPVYNTGNQRTFGQ